MLSFISNLAKNQYTGGEDQEVIDFELATLEELHRDNDIDCLLNEMDNLAAMEIKDMYTRKYE